MLLPFSPIGKEKVSLSASEMMEHIMLEKNGKPLDFFLGEVSTDRINAIQVLLYQASCPFCREPYNLLNFNCQYAAGSLLEYGICTF